MAHGLVPKVENVDPSVMMPQQAVRFPQALPNQQQSLALPGSHHGTLRSQPKPALQRQMSNYEGTTGSTPEQFLMRHSTPRPGMPPQLLPQVVNPASQVVPLSALQGSVSPHPSVSKPPQVVTSQSLPIREPFKEHDKTSQRWSHGSSDSGIQINVQQGPATSQPSGYFFYL